SSHMSSPFCFSYRRPLRDLHSFPTRRSSDLRGHHWIWPRCTWWSVGQVSPPPVLGDTIGRCLTSVKEEDWLDTLDNSFQRKPGADRKSTRLNSSHLVISYAVFCLKKKKNTNT